MLRAQTSLLILCGATLVGVVAVGCRNGETGRNPASDSGAQGLEGFFDPQVKETWTYAGIREFPPGTPLSPRDAERAVVLPSGALRIQFERRRVCVGSFRPEGSDQEFTTFEIYEDGVLTEREIYDIGRKGVIGRGWAPADQPLDAGVVLDPGLQIAVPNMAGGQSWVVANEGQNRVFQVEVIERSDLSVPVGIFDAARLRFTTTQGKRSTKRTIWFAENVGIVKEETVHYDADEVRVRESLELVGWLLPSLAREQGAPSAADPGDSDPTTRVPPPNGRVPVTAPVMPDSTTSAEPGLDAFLRDFIDDPYDHALPGPYPVNSSPPPEGPLDDAASNE